MNGDENEKQCWLSFIPYSLRNDTNVSDSAKVLYTFISSLCDKEGYCWATNEYLAKITGKNPRTTRRNLLELKEANHINISVVRNDKNEVVQRKIYLTVYAPNISATPSGQKCPYPMDKNVHTSGQKCPVEDNKILSKQEMKIFPLFSPLKVGKDTQPLEPSSSDDNDKEKLFDEFWNEYPTCKRKSNKASCKTAYLRIPNLKQEHELIMQGLKLWKKDDEWKQYGGQYIPAPLVFIHQKKWEGKLEERGMLEKQEKEEAEAKKITENDINAFNEEFGV